MLASLGRGALLAFVGAALGLTVNAVRPDGVRLRTFAAPTQCEGEAGPPDEMSPADAAAACGRSDVLVADARPAARFAEGHVAGAIHLPCDAGGRVASDALKQLGAARVVIVYGERTDDARPVADSLKR